MKDFDLKTWLLTNIKDILKEIDKCDFNKDEDLKKVEIVRNTVLLKEHLKSLNKI